MKIETALQKPRSVQQLMKLTGLSRGGVLGGLKRLKAKKAGEKRQGQRGPASTLYALRGTSTVKAKSLRTVRKAMSAPQVPTQAEIEAETESYPTAEITPEQIVASTGVAAPEFVQGVEPTYPDYEQPEVLKAAEPTAEAVKAANECA